MRIVFEKDKCQGHGRCYALAEELFEADDEGYSVLLVDGEVPAELEHKAELAVENCPEFAISLEK